MAGSPGGVSAQGTADVPQEPLSEKGVEARTQSPGADVAPSIKDGAASSRMQTSVTACPPGPPLRGRYVSGSRPLKGSAQR